MPWREGLSRTSKKAFGRLAGILRATEIKPETWNDLEELLIQADLGIDTVTSIITSLQQTVREAGLTRAFELREVLRSRLQSKLRVPPTIEWKFQPYVILIVGVNGSGKTTSIANLCHTFQEKGKSVILGAADTFRAAAVDQLQVWGTRLKVDVVTGDPGSDAGAVAFNTVQAGMARKTDLVIIDTAGRLHTRFNLMEELKKVHRVIGKAFEGAPHAVWLVLDATTGQNALIQARAFKEAVGVTGVILAKLDSSARGGMAFSIQDELKLPILFAGLGEKIEDLKPFNPADFVDGILSSWEN